jgi:hypothetical protein
MTLAAIIFAGLIIQGADAMRTAQLPVKIISFGPLSLYQLSKIPQADHTSLVTMRVLPGIIVYVAGWCFVAVTFSLWRLRKLHPKIGKAYAGRG